MQILLIKGKSIEELEKRIAELEIQNKKNSNLNFKFIEGKQLASMTLEELNEYEEKCKNAKKAIKERKVRNRSENTL